MKAIILAAGKGKRIRGFTEDPKCLIRINDDEPLIVREVRLLNKYGIRDIIIVTGYKSAKVVTALENNNLRAKFINNKYYKNGSIVSLWLAIKNLKSGVLIMDADLYFEEAVIKKLVKSKKRNFFLIDSMAKVDDEAVIVGFKTDQAVMLARGLKGDFDLSGEWAGLLKLSAAAASGLRRLFLNEVKKGERKIGYEFIIPKLFSKYKISAELVDKYAWIEIDCKKDVAKAKRLKIK